MSESKKVPIAFWEKVRAEILEIVKPQKLFLYGVTIVVFSIVSLSLPYKVQVYLSIIAGIIVVLLLVASLVLMRGLKKLDVVFIGGIIFLFMALFPKEFLTSIFPSLDFLRDFKHLSRVLSIALTTLYVGVGLFQVTHIEPRGASMKVFRDFFSVCGTTISSELCFCLHPIPFLDILLMPLGVADLLLNRVKLGFVIMMVTLTFQIKSSYESFKNKKSLALADSRFTSSLAFTFYKG